MIVETMTHAEAFRELDADRDNVNRWLDHRADELRRKALKATKFPVTWWLDYTSPRKNRYMIGVTCTRRKFSRYHAISPLVLRREQRGFSVYMTPLERQSLVRRTVFLPHFFDRYAERMGVKKQGVDLIRYFFDRQTGGTILTDQRLAGRGVRYNGRDHKFVPVQDGVTLGDMQDGIFVFRTFITYDMATGVQRDVFNGAQKELFDIEDEIAYVNAVRLFDVQQPATLFPT